MLYLGDTLNTLLDLIFLRFCCSLDKSLICIFFLFFVLPFDSLFSQFNPRFGMTILSSCVGSK